MTKKYGKVKSVPVTEVTEGMQVIHNNRICKITSINHGSKERPNYTPVILDGNYGTTKDMLKTLVVEYESISWEEHIKDLIFSSAEAKRNIFEGWERDYIKQIPLKYKQWQSAIDNGEVDSDKIVEFEIRNDEKMLRTSEKDGKKYHILYAKIIPNKMNRSTIEQFNKIADVRIYLLNHPDKEMIKQSCLHYLGDRYQEFSQKKEKPSEEQQLERLADLLTSHNVRKYLNTNGFGYSQVERDIVKLFNNMLK